MQSFSLESEVREQEGGAPQPNHPIYIHTACPGSHPLQRPTDDTTRRGTEGVWARSTRAEVVLVHYNTHWLILAKRQGKHNHHIDIKYEHPNLHGTCSPPHPTDHVHGFMIHSQIRPWQTNLFIADFKLLRLPVP